MIHIVPSVPPTFNGLGDYCYHLWKHWPEPKPEWHVAVAYLPDGAREAWPEARLMKFEMSGPGLLKALKDSNADKVVLHYVGYGYSRRGIPFWLPKALSQWKRSGGGKVVVMFHELYATGPPWKSEFWLCLPQKRIARQLANLADRWITSCPHYMDVLTNLLHADPNRGEMIPVGSSIEPVREPEWDRPWPLSYGEKLKVAVFGNPLTRLRALRKHQGLLRHLAASGDLGEVRLIGRSDSRGKFQAAIEQILASVEPKPVMSSYLDLPSAGVSEALVDCHLGLVENTFGILYKSSSYAAYAVHGLLPVIPTSVDAKPGLYWQNGEFFDARTCSSLEGAYHEKGQRGTDFQIAAMTQQFAAACEAIR